MNRFNCNNIVVKCRQIVVILIEMVVTCELDECRRATSLRALLTGKSIRNKLRVARNSREEEKRIVNTTPVSVAADPAARVASPPGGERRFSRLFSLRRSSTTSSTIENGPPPSTTKCCVSDGAADLNKAAVNRPHLPQLLEEEEI